MSSHGTTYPQAQREAWSAAAAAHDTAVWRCVDARARLALAFMDPPARQQRLQQQLEALCTARDATFDRLRTMQADLCAAEAEYYATT